MNIKELTKKLINLAQISDEINGEIIELEEIISKLGWNIKKIYTTNPRNGNKVPHYLLTIGEGETNIGFVSHYDVVGYGSGWNTEANIATEIDSKIYGRGSSDMLSGLAVELLMGPKFKDKLKLSIFLVGDEEVDGEGIKQLFNKIDSKIDYIIGSEPTANNETGDAIKIGRRGVIGGEIKLFGNAFHAAYIKKQGGFNLPEFIINGGLKDLLKDIDSKEGKMPASTFAINNIKTSYIGTNTVPEEITIGFNSRTQVRWNKENYKIMLESKLDKLGIDYEVNINTEFSPYYTDNKNFETAITNSIKKITQKDVDINCEGGSSDCVIFGKNSYPTIEIGVPNSTIHKPNEFVSIKNLEFLEKIYIQILEDLI